LFGSEREVHRTVLRNRRHPLATRSGGQVLQVRAVERNTAVVWFEQSVEQAKECGLARAVGADESDELSGLDGDVDAR
jgi:hypothetical protein